MMNPETQRVLKKAEYSACAPRRCGGQTMRGDVLVPIFCGSLRIPHNVEFHSWRRRGFWAAKPQERHLFLLTAEGGDHTIGEFALKSPVQ